MAKPRGHRTGNAALSEGQVAHIKVLLQKGISAREIAQANDVGLETIRRIGRGDTWAWVEAVETIPTAAQEFSLMCAPTEQERIDIAASEARLDQMLKAEPVKRMTLEEHREAAKADPYAFMREGKE